LIENTLKLLRPKLALSHIVIQFEIRGDTDFFCSGSEIQQVLTNIINNAAEAMKGPGKVRIRASDSVDWKARDQKGVRITIADTGSGMSPETLRRMQEPFFTTKEGTGTGLGMWVVRELIEKHKGTMSVRSCSTQDRHGTTISLFIPSGPAADDQQTLVPQDRPLQRG
jgi:two-component system CheB/CheR fusion protein